MIDPGHVTTEAVKTGVGLGTIVAAILSWDRNKSIAWMILHAFLSWFYVVYYALTDKKQQSARAIIYVVLSIFLIHLFLIIGLSVYYMIKK